MDFEIDRRKLLKATGAGMATVTIATGAASAVTDLADLPGDGTEANPYELDSFDDLLAIDQDLDANYILTDNIEFEGEGPISPLAFGGGDGYYYYYYGGSSFFTGTLDGQGYEIRNFEIEGSYYSGSTGLFAGIGPGGVVKNLNIVNINVTEGGPTGGLAGEFDGGQDGEIRNVSATGTVEGGFRTGGLVGRMSSGTITDSSSSATVGGSNEIGGLVGRIDGGEIIRTYAEGDVGPAGESSGFDVGGFVGELDDGNLTLCFATGNVEGGDNVGGFAGNFDDGTVTKAYARGDVTGIGGEAGPLGGFVGDMGSFSGTPTVEEVYSTGAVTNGFGGGLIGSFDPPENGSINEPIFSLSSHANISYWDVPASGQETSDGGVGLGDIEDTPPADEMTGDDAPNNMAGFDFDNTWVAITGDENAIIGFRPAETQITVQATQPTGPGYPVFGWQIEEDEKTCIDRRKLGRGQEDDECPFDRDIERGGSRRELDRNTGRGGDGEHTDSETSRRDRGRGSRRGR